VSVIDFRTGKKKYTLTTEREEDMDDNIREGDCEPTWAESVRETMDNAFEIDLTQEEALVAQLLNRLVPGFTTADEHHRETPRRFVKMLKQLTIPEPFSFTTFPAKSDNMVVLGPIPFYTLCAHHVVPFYGNAWIGYVPDQLLAGLSKFARAVKHVAKGLHVQEELTAEIADFIEDNLSPKGVAVVMKAEHLCMAMRGVETAGVITTTAEMRGVFGDHERTAKAEFLEWIR
jgi:GTP cyclohydrolase I